jgi:hypothetical protein
MGPNGHTGAFPTLDLEPCLEFDGGGVSGDEPGMQSYDPYEKSFRGFNCGLTPYLWGDAPIVNLSLCKAAEWLFQLSL